MVRVANDYGHKDQDSGAVANGFKEVDLNYEVGQACTEELRRHSIDVFEPSGSLNNRINQINAANVDVIVSFHNNAGGGDGTEILIYEKGGKAEQLAQKVYDKVVPALNNGRGIKERTNLGVLKRTTKPAILIECAFMDTKDIQCIDEAHERKEWGIAIAKGILEYFNIPYKGQAQKEIYRVRKNWSDATSQKGAYSSLENAKKCADDNPGYNVFDAAGNKIYGGKVIAVGSTVKIIGTHYATGQAISVWAKNLNKHTVAQIDGDRALLKEINSWCFIKDLI